MAGETGCSGRKRKPASLRIPRGRIAPIVTGRRRLIFDGREPGCPRHVRGRSEARREAWGELVSRLRQEGR